MRTLLILCATLTILQVLDVPISGFSAKVEEDGKTDSNKKESTFHLFKKTRSELKKYGKGVLSGVLKHVTRFGKSTLRLGGTVMKMPLSIGSNVIDVADQFARIPSKISDAVAQKTVYVLSNGKNVDSNEHQTENKDEHHRVEYHPKNVERQQINKDHSRVEEPHKKKEEQQVTAVDHGEKEEKRHEAKEEHKEKDEEHNESKEDEHEEEDHGEGKEDQSDEK